MKVMGQLLGIEWVATLFIFAVNINALSISETFP